MTNWKLATEHEVAATTSPAICIHTVWCCKERFFYILTRNQAPILHPMPVPSRALGYPSCDHTAPDFRRAMKHHQKYPRVSSEAVAHRLACLWAVFPHCYFSSLQHNLCKTFSLLGTRKPTITPSRYCCRSASWGDVSITALGEQLSFLPRGTSGILPGMSLAPSIFLLVVCWFFWGGREGLVCADGKFEWA